MVRQKLINYKKLKKIYIYPCLDKIIKLIMNYLYFNGLNSQFIKSSIINIKNNTDYDCLINIGKSQIHSDDFSYKKINMKKKEKIYATIKIIKKLGNYSTMIDKPNLIPREKMMNINNVIIKIINHHKEKCILLLTQYLDDEIYYERFYLNLEYDSVINLSGRKSGKYSLTIIEDVIKIYNSDIEEEVFFSIIDEEEKINESIFDENETDEVILGFINGYNPSLIELKKAYKKLAKIFHPDKVLEEQKKKATNEFIKFKNAYDRLLKKILNKSSNFNNDLELELEDLFINEYIKKKRVKKTIKKNKKKLINKMNNIETFNELDELLLEINYNFNNELQIQVEKIDNKKISIKFINIINTSEYKISLSDFSGNIHTTKTGKISNNKIIIDLRPGDNFLDIEVLFKTQNIIILPNNKLEKNIFFDDNYLKSSNIIDIEMSLY